MPDSSRLTTHHFEQPTVHETAPQWTPHKFRPLQLSELACEKCGRVEGWHWHIPDTPDT